MTRFFVSPSQISGDQILLDAGDAHHLRIVLQALPGEPIAILDGAGNEFSAILLELGKNRALARITGSRKLETEATTRITVAQALPKVSDKVEQVLQRCTEIGAAAFLVFESEKGITHLQGERQAKREVRWGEIVKTAAEQAHRALLPPIAYPASLNAVLSDSSNYDAVLLAHPAAEAQALSGVVRSWVESPLKVLIVVGPESGFTREELAHAAARGATVVSLGARILRTETAAMAMTSQLLYALES